MSRISRRKQKRSGAIYVLSAFLIIPVLAFVAFATDVGYINTVRAELSRTADSSALAAAAAIYPQIGTLSTTQYNVTPNPTVARNAGHDYAKYNGGGAYNGTSSGDHLHLHRNFSNDADGDIVIGQLNNPANLTEPLTVTEDFPNTVLVRIALTEDHSNGPVSLFLAPVLGFANVDVSAWAMAVVEFPSLLPFATSEDKWNSLATGGDGDSYYYGSGGVTSGWDGLSEIQIFPDNNWDGTGLPPGNFGSLQIGPIAGTEILRRQIDKGPSMSDFAHHGGTLSADMQIPGKTGVNGDIKTAFNGGNADEREYAGIIGKTRFMPLYSAVSGNGSNALFTISRFVTVRIMYVKMTGNPKWIVVQPIDQTKDLFNVYLSR